MNKGFVTILTEKSSPTRVGKVLEENGVKMPDASLNNFVGGLYRAAAEDFFENTGTRIVPPERAVAWANRYLQLAQHCGPMTA